MTPGRQRQWDIALPAGYRVQDLLSFHGRDTESVAEQIGPSSIRKGVLLDGVALLLDIDLRTGHAACRASADARLTPAAWHAVHGALLNMLGLRIDPQPFETLAAGDALLAPLVQAHPGLRIMQSASVFEALTWAIIGQQINLPFAIALRRTFILQAGRRHSGGLWCYPEAADVLRLDVDDLTSRKFSRAKADTLLRVAQLVHDGVLSLAAPASGDMAPVRAALLAVKGIGPWTANYALLRGYGYADCSLHGDVAIRNALQVLLGEPVKPDMRRTEQWLARYAPQRTMLAAHLWASRHKQDN
ncbi:DNA-3-methyladenine glycosylase family protein [Janthinobacterium agaricidamnosum]|uniref:DNA-3-methyladenine glycosylase II n=1 Tax=Janthinobacterium agaricidamnosum NBRC 102515 = DSM 9628 TaxID=1349767 RepID=W0V2H7_9BURK|nr:DNA-3-methyladenine glycosylase 2 [Janthinobacterium agaricidamnosum]CDG81825.1 DNA-3-methyladenine glycosidase II [Janthinobacterium agaricidamnosum NBRC 102515 = DSM 9628]